MDAATEGAFRGQIAITGPSGAASVDVDVEVAGSASAPSSGPSAGVLTEPASVPVHSDVVPTPSAAPAAPADKARGEPAGNRGVRIAGLCALVGSGLLVAGLFRTFRYGQSLSGEDPDAAWYVLITAALAAAASVSTVVPRPSRVVGPGILLGLLMTPIWGLAFLASFVPHGGLESGYWLDVLGQAASLLAGWIVGAAVVVFTYAAHLGRIRYEQGASVSGIPLAAYALTLVGMSS